MPTERFKTRAASSFLLLTTQSLSLFPLGFLPSKWPTLRSRRLPRSLPVRILFTPSLVLLSMACLLLKCKSDLAYLFSRLHDGRCLCCKYSYLLRPVSCPETLLCFCRPSRKHPLLPLSVSSSWCRTRMRWYVTFICFEDHG